MINYLQLTSKWLSKVWQIQHVADITGKLYTDTKFIKMAINAIKFIWKYHPLNSHSDKLCDKNDL